MFFWGLWLFSFWTETYSVENYTFIYFSGLAPKKGSRNEAQIWATNTEGALCTFSVCGPDCGFKCGTIFGSALCECTETPLHTNPKKAAEKHSWGLAQPVVPEVDAQQRRSIHHKLPHITHTRRRARVGLEILLSVPPQLSAGSHCANVGMCYVSN